MADSVPAKEELEACLKSLESRPQWWTSYSNSRQNAMVICQATRVEMEKEELLELHRTLVEGTSKLSDGLHEALRQAAAKSEQYKAFIAAVDLMHKSVTAELAQSESQLKRTLTIALSGIESATDSVVAGVHSMLGRVEAKTQGLEQACIALPSLC